MTKPVHWSLEACDKEQVALTPEAQLPQVHVKFQWMQWKQNRRNSFKSLVKSVESFQNEMHTETCYWNRLAHALQWPVINGTSVKCSWWSPIQARQQLPLENIDVLDCWLDCFIWWTFDASRSYIRKKHMFWPTTTLIKMIRTSTLKEV